MNRHILLKISPGPSLPSGPEALWAGGQRGEFLPFVFDPERFLTRRVKGRKVGDSTLREGFGLRCLHNYGLTNKLKIKPAFIPQNKMEMVKTSPDEPIDFF